MILRSEWIWEVMMKADQKRIPTEEQRNIIDAPDAHFNVIAAAGAGKTFVLVERYLRHIEVDGLRPDQILTITFTKKAAAEMKDRIVKRLRESERYEDAQIAETGPIQTIHSFCERVLRENALEAGLDPQYEILAEDQSARMVTACIREAMASDLEEMREAEDLIRSIAGKRLSFGDNRSQYGLLESNIESVLKELRSSRYSAEDLRGWYSRPSVLKGVWDEAVRNSLPEAVRDEFDKTIGSTFGERVQRASKNVGVKPPDWAKGAVDAEAEQESLRHTCGIVQLACEAWWRLEAEMKRQQVLDFAGLELRTDQLLNRSQVTRERLAKQYKVVMVDESQDVNPIQYRLLDRLGSERSMMVGDAQQSIYGFRQADVRLFRERTARTHTKRLTKNWRSDPGILNFVDAVFSGMWGSEYAPMNVKEGPMDFDIVEQPNFDGVEIWRQPSKSPKSTAGYITELLVEGVEPRDIAILVRDGGAALNALKALEEKGIAARIVGGSEKFYTRLEVRDLANTLRAVADPYDDFALLATLRSPMVGLSMDSIVLLGKDPFVVDRMEAFEPPIEEDREKLLKFLSWYQPLFKMADRLSAWEVLAKVFSDSDYLQALARRPKGDQMLANARKLLMLATEEPDLGPLEYSDRIRVIQDLRHKEGDAPADDNDANQVKILTIHKAKGLEWPVVVLPQTDKKLTAIARPVIVDPIHGLVATKFGKTQSVVHKLLVERKKVRDDAEERRVLYVALTRAQKRLCITIVPSSNVMTVSTLLQSLFDPAQMPGLKVRNTHATPSGPV